MAYNEIIADRMREALLDIPKVEEKKMFRGITFMVDDKMCISVSGNEIMCRIDPLLHDELVEKNGCRVRQFIKSFYILCLLNNKGW